MKPFSLAVPEEEDCQVTVVRLAEHSFMLPGCSGKFPLFVAPPIRHSLSFLLFFHSCLIFEKSGAEAEHTERSRL